MCPVSNIYKEMYPIQRNMYIHTEYITEIYTYIYKIIQTL